MRFLPEPAARLPGPRDPAVTLEEVDRAIRRLHPEDDHRGEPRDRTLRAQAGR